MSLQHRASVRIIDLILTFTAYGSFNTGIILVAYEHRTAIKSRGVCANKIIFYGQKYSLQVFKHRGELFVLLSIVS